MFKNSHLNAILNPNQQDKRSKQLILQKQSKTNSLIKITRLSRNTYSQMNMEFQVGSNILVMINKTSSHYLDYMVQMTKSNIYYNLNMIQNQNYSYSMHNHINQFQMVMLKILNKNQKVLLIVGIIFILFTATLKKQLWFYLNTKMERVS